MWKVFEGLAEVLEIAERSTLATAEGLQRLVIFRPLCTRSCMVIEIGLIFGIGDWGEPYLCRSRRHAGVFPLLHRPPSNRGFDIVLFLAISEVIFGD